VVGNYLWCNLPVWCSCRTCINYAGVPNLWYAKVFHVVRESLSILSQKLHSFQFA